jgi:hypothetical protein
VTATQSVHLIDCDLGLDCTCLWRDVTLPVHRRADAMDMGLFGLNALSANEILETFHYLGPSHRGTAYRDEFGVVVFAAPTSRRLPRTWVELTRWCIASSEKNAGTQQWRSALRFIRATFPLATTVVSYSDPAHGHTGALYRACNWLWAPTWLRLREPPSGNGSWDGTRQAAKDRWVYPLSPDPSRQSLLAVQDESLMRAMPWASYVEPKWRRAKPRLDTGGGDYRRWLSESTK